MIPLPRDLQYRILKRISPDGGEAASQCKPAAFEGARKIDVLLGKELLDCIRGKTVIDFGCGGGREAVEFARSGATRVIGLEIVEDILVQARKRADEAGVGHICTFAARTDVRADVIVCLDAFEHFPDAAGALRIMDELLVPEGEVIFSFGPPWLHPLGGHLFSVFPWAHLLFSESAFMRWRSTFKTDGATRFEEVSGGLNRMTIRRFERLVAASPFRFAAFEALPIRKLRLLHNRWTREFITAAVRGRLVKRAR